MCINSFNIILISYTNLTYLKTSLHYNLIDVPLKKAIADLRLKQPLLKEPGAWEDADGPDQLAAQHLVHHTLKVAHDRDWKREQLREELKQRLLRVAWSQEAHEGD